MRKYVYANSYKRREDRLAKARIADIAKARQHYGEAAHIWAKEPHKVARLFKNYKADAVFLEARTLLDPTNPVKFYAAFPTPRLEGWVEDLIDELEQLLGCSVTIKLIMANETPRGMVELRFPTPRRNGGT